MLSTSFNCSAIRAPLRRRSSSATRAQHSARQACAALSLMRLFGSRTEKSASQSASFRTASGSSPASAKNVGQEGFDALVHRVFPGIPADRPWRLRRRQGGQPRRRIPRRPLSQRGALNAKGSAAGAMPLLMRAARRQGMFGPMANPYGIRLDDTSLRWAAAEGVSEAVIAAICLLPERSVDKIVAKLSPVELEQVIKIVGRSPRGYPSGALEALKGKRNSAQPQRPTERLSPNVALKPGQPAHTNSGTERSPGSTYGDLPRPASRSLRHYAISVYIAVLAVISFIATALMPDYTGKDISDDAYSED